MSIWEQLISMLPAAATSKYLVQLSQKDLNNEHSEYEYDENTYEDDQVDLWVPRWKSTFQTKEIQDFV